MPIAQRVFGPVGPNGEIEIRVVARGGHVLAASLAAAEPGRTLLIQPFAKTFSDYLWRLPIQAGVPVAVVARPPTAATAPLPWVEPRLFTRLAIAIFPGSGAPERNLNADVVVFRNSAPLPPHPLLPMVFPGDLLPPPGDVSRSTVVELVFERL